MLLENLVLMEPPALTFSAIPSLHFLTQIVDVAICIKLFFPDCASF